MTRKIKSHYDTDFYLWALKTAKLIRAHKIEEIEWDNVAEEIESVGNSQRSELVSRLVVLIGHLLKWQFQPGRQGSSWRGTIVEQRTAIQLLLEDNPSLRNELEKQVLRAYRAARNMAIVETGLQKKLFPINCSYTIKQILNYDFLPE